MIIPNLIILVCHKSVILTFQKLFYKRADCILRQRGYLLLVKVVLNVCVQYTKYLFDLDLVWRMQLMIIKG